MWNDSKRDQALAWVIIIFCKVFMFALCLQKGGYWWF